MNRTIHKLYIGSFIVIGLIIVLGIAVMGYTFYILPVEERFFHPDYSLLKPSGLAGHGFGIIGSLFMLVGVGIYMLRKRVRKFGHIGVLKHWLEFHIFLCSVGPFLVLYHTSFKFGGLVSIAFWSMAAVTLSGVIGRFIYLQIPRTIQGQEYSLAELDMMYRDNINELKTGYPSVSGLIQKHEAEMERDPSRNISGGQKFIQVFGDYFRMRKFLSGLKSALKDSGYKEKSEITGKIKNTLTLRRKINSLKIMQKYFGYWHVIHLPFALVMLFIALIHIGVSIFFGYTWIF